MKLLLFASSSLTCNKKSHKSVADFYSGKSVFITGGTGFIGMALIEKLLYSCTDIKNIYVLIRGTQKFTVEERLQNLLENPVFSRLKEEKLSVFKKIVPISGNMELPNLGITIKDETTLIEQIGVVFHLAATIHFNEPLKKALKINYEGTEQIIKLCKKMKNIEGYVHVSTAYSNTDKMIIEEKIYPAPADINDVNESLKSIGDDDEKIKKILNNRPNTYTFTKALTENLVASEGRYTPTVIIRPTMVGPAMSEPVKGWLHQISATSFLLYAGGKGFNRVMRGEKTNIIDIVPVDYVTNLIIVAASARHRSEDTIVYNCGSGYLNPIYLGEIFELFKQSDYENSFMDKLQYKVFIVKNRTARFLLTYLTQIIPSCILDLRLILQRKSPRYLKLQRKFIVKRNDLDYFSQNSWLFKAENLEKLKKNMTEEDQKTFCVDVSNIKWPDYMITYAKSVQAVLDSTKR